MIFSAENEQKGRFLEKVSFEDPKILKITKGTTVQKDNSEIQREREDKKRRKQELKYSQRVERERRRLNEQYQKKQKSGAEKRRSLEKHPERQSSKDREQIKRSQITDIVRQK